MTIVKQRIIPGTIILVSKQGLGLTSKPGSVFDGVVYPAIGEELQILSKPKKYDGINCVKLGHNSKEYYAYYCEVRYNTKEKD